MINVDRFKVHELFNSNNTKAIGDFSVLHLAERLVYNSMVQEIKIARDIPKANDTATVSGWFRKSDLFVDHLRYYKTKIASVSSDVFSTMSMRLFIIQKDEGALVINKKLAGVVSIGNTTSPKYANLAHSYHCIRQTADALNEN